MLTLSNLLTLLRLPVAFLFIIDNIYVRLLAIFLAMISDGLDGYFARKHKTVSQLGAALDPIMDKFFVFFALGILVATDQMPFWAMMAMISRDFFLFLYAVYLTISHSWDRSEFKANIWGKITTVAQLIILVLIVVKVSIPWYIFVAFIPLGFLTTLAIFKGLKKKDSSH